MDPGLIGVIIGGIIGIAGSAFATTLHDVIEKRDRRNSIIKVTKVEITTIREKAERFLEGKSTLDELKSSTPLWASLAPELGHLSVEQAIAARRAVTLDMEMRNTGNKTKVEDCSEACKLALDLL